LLYLKNNSVFLKYYILLLYPKVRFYVTVFPQKRKPIHRSLKNLDSLNIWPTL